MVKNGIGLMNVIGIGSLSGLITSLIIYKYSDYFKPINKKSTNSISKTRKSSEKEKEEEGENLIKEQLIRHESFFGELGNQQIRKSYVVVIGLGGVGSHVSLSLIRSGVRRIKLIDFDLVSLSSLNRHAVATRNDVGKPKVEVCREFFRRISPWIEIEIEMREFNSENAKELLMNDSSEEGEEVDWVLDCIDNITTKLDLLTFCKTNQIKVISSLGAASKSDPSRIQISDISLTFEDPLARSVRRRLRMKGIVDGIPVVYSTEKPNEKVTLLPLPEEEFQKGNVQELSSLTNFRVRILPVLGPIPAMFGQAMAAYVLSQLSGFPIDPLPVKNRTKLYKRLYNDLLSRESKLTGTTTIPFSIEEIGYIFEEIYRGKSIVSPNFVISNTLCLIRWDSKIDLNWQNCVVMDRSEAELHEEKVLRNGVDPQVVWDPQTVGLVMERFEEELRMRKWR
ncbi:uncharacterized protein MELLADRAFT_44716 [Melampsora larici-populina 98AG31]|uniref:THIF-type NAD/FAD binding fold domain-containing protein n=1 Tax=Melampsora larici-populina (strain 98AG31 / pathotype 3-4-7) TaxID=747676 RepID=F4RX96_MELLP|nr:uncharacterized protein MELLADRAFT_44716 [Melampsora larici-populina 98AG31]EGG03025.1 hypothetical protein MELLADRAFT_44716 [Melampsora larici-populina 98AG31]